MEKETERNMMTKFWKEHSKFATVEEMMLDSNAQELTQHELPEILSLLPSLAASDVLELGAGIGRYTRHLIGKARHVTAVDFMEKFVEKNRKDNSHLGNTEFIQADVTKLDFPKHSFDVVFSNWLLMYLSDQELKSLAEKLLMWLRPGGYLFFRESCFHQSGDCKRDFNPTLYRSPAYYNHLMTSVLQDESEKTEKKCYGFDMVVNKTVQTYVKVKNNQNQLCWLMQKVRRDVVQQHQGGFSTFQEFLDNQQYTRRGILRYEKMFGSGYVSTGGISTTKVRDAEYIGSYIFRGAMASLHASDGHGECLGKSHAEDALLYDFPPIALIPQLVFSIWCTTRGKDPASCDISRILSFLQELFDKGRSPSTLKVYVAAIAAYHAPVAGQSVGRNNLVVRFLKGSRRLNPPRPATVPTWDLSTRMEDLQALSVSPSCLEFGPNNSKVVLKPRLRYIPKVLSTTFRAQVITLSTLPPSEDDQELNLLCPVRTLRIYIKHSAPIRQSEQLFICFGGRTKGFPVTKQRLSRWIVDAIELAYSSFGLHCPMGVRAHLTRGMASSWAWSSGVSIAEICAVAGWASPSTFARFYNLDVRISGLSLALGQTSTYALPPYALGPHRVPRLLSDLPLQVQFEVSDATKRKFPDSTFDVVYSRDTILHIRDKLDLFRKFYSWLKPGGKLLISDYCCGEKPWSPAFQDYVNQRGYILYTPQRYGQFLSEVGFSNVRAEDRTEQFIQVIKAELQRAGEMKEEFIQEFSQEDYDAVVNGWTKKLQRCETGDQRWGLFYATKE
ncbi:phosphoethanolamine N-methyltransferase 3-like [Sinocyclocheilus rhinocerous]|uniref:phosphoethanolamine N-methyltransferase 3-like n=1 Tax=Sinocyclocheilus rhinocerous TaxID=307959 RepID=UPI0007B79F14|nr:PREDICTED: phosphoethanolamine N-methyltransferase 3-like [Sinocyclocheilus rhinocerous]